MRNGFWNGRRVLVTGHTGFKGSWLCLWLTRQGAHVTGLGLAPGTDPALYTLSGLDEMVDSHLVDIRESGPTIDTIRTCDPEVVFHLAAQPLVRVSYDDPVGTFAANVMGTTHVLEALRGTAARVAVLITTDKVYRNHEWSWPYRETDTLGGHDPYSASKAACEIVIDSYRSAFLQAAGTVLASARAGNVIGGGDWAADRLIPDAIRAWQQDRELEIRRPEAIRPWQHVLEPLGGYLRLARACWEDPRHASAWNFGPATHEAATVREVIELARKTYGTGAVRYGDGTQGPHEAGWLALETAKARTDLGLTPRWSLAASVDRTVAWYRRLQEGADARALCEADIAAYEGAE